MKRLRLVATSFLIAFFALAQMPSEANCQILPMMSAGQCAMPCCQRLAKSMPMSPQCPMLKTAPQTVDTMTPHANFLRNGFHALFIFSKLQTLETPKSFSRIPQIADAFYYLVFERPSLGRSPPSDITLLSA
jgi:hypothetical protein